MTIDTVLFDLGNVLQFFSVDRWHRQLAVLGRTEPDAVARARADSGVIDAFERGELAEDDVRTWFERTFAVTVTADDFFTAYSDIFETNEPMLPVLAGLKASGRRLVLLSNTSAAHVRWIRERTPVLGYFDDCVVSYEVGAMKPDARIFAEALRRIACPPERCLYTDDIERYVLAARTHGLDAVVFTTAEQFVADVAARGVHLPA